MHKKVWSFVRGHLRTVIIWGVLLTLLYAFLVFRIGSLFPGASAAEIAYFHDVSSGKLVLTDPTYLPHKLPAYITVKLSHSITGVRMVSAGFTLLFIVAAWTLLNRIFSRRTAIMGTLLLIFNSWVLIIARSAQPDASYLLAIAAGTLVMWLVNIVDSWKIVPLILLVSLPFIYVPGLVYVLIVAAALYRRQIAAAAAAMTNKQRLATGCLILLLILPLLAGLIAKPSILATLFGIPTALSAYQSLGESIIDNLSSLFWRSEITQSMTLATLPYLDVFTTVLLLFGLYRMRFWPRQTILWVFAVAGILTILTGLAVVPLSAVLPLIYAMVIYGVSFLLTQWYTVFPRNPVVRAIGASLLILSVLIIGYYHIVKFYVAWPLTPQTKTIYNQVLIK